MKNKIIIGVCIAFVVLAITNIDVYAAQNMTCTETGFVVIYESGRYYVWHCAMNKTTISSTWFEWCTTTAIPITQYYDLNSAVANGMSFINNSSNYIGNTYIMQRQTIPSSAVYLYNVPPLNSGLTDSKPPDVVNWYETMWDNFRDYWNDPEQGNVVQAFVDWITGVIENVFDNDSESTISDNVSIGNPTLAPTPTPIPYSTVVIPKTDIVTGDTVYETNYYYVNPSGTPIITNSPPTNTPPSGGGGGGSTEYVPVGGDPFSIPTVNWLSSATIGDSNYDGIDSINDGMRSIDSIGSEYSDGMSAVQDSTGTLPTTWLLLIGIAAAIPLLAGIVSRFLGG